MKTIFLITIDSLRADRFTKTYFSNCWGTFETEFARFTAAYANGVATPLSFPSIHTGHQVTGSGALDRDAPTVAELYDGYTFAISNNPHLRPERGYDRGFDSFTDKTTDPDDSIFGRVRSVAGRSDLLRAVHRTVMALRDWRSPPDLSPSTTRTAGYVLDELRDALASQSGFFWVHLMDAHYPFVPQKVLDRQVDVALSDEELQRINDVYKDMTGATADERTLTDDQLNCLEGLYDEIVGYLDRKLAALFDHLRSTGRWDDAMVVVMSDHGEAFGEQGVYNHDWTADPIDPLVRVPLAVKYPSGVHAGKTIDHPVQNADLLATLAERCDWSVETPPHTRPLLDDTRRPVVSKSNAAVRVTTDSGHAIRRGESVDVTGDVNEEALSLLGECSVPAVENLSGDVPGLSQREQDELEQRLAYLGYK